MENHLITFVILFGIFTVFLIRLIWLRKKKNSSKFYILIKDLKKDLLRANFEGDWKERQKIYLQIHWLNSVIGSNSVNQLGRRIKPLSVARIIKLSEDQLKFPLKWSLESMIHFNYFYGIMLSYGRILTENEYQNLVYKPDSVLPFPKSEIRKAYHFLIDFLNFKNPINLIPDMPGYAKNLNMCKLILELNFVNLSEKDLPKSPNENALNGNQTEKSSPSDADELDFIDWRTVGQWITCARNYMQDNKFQMAEKCLNKALEMNVSNNDIRKHFGLMHLIKAEFYNDIGEEIKSEDNRIMAQNFGVTYDNLQELFSDDFSNNNDSKS